MSQSQIKTEDKSIFTPLANSKDLVVQETGDELLIYKLQSNKAVCLNKTSALIWQQCNGKNDVRQITKNLEKTLDSFVDENLVWFAINQLDKEGLISSNENIPNNFLGLSRREVIKKVGFTSMIALPIISSIVAPKATYAASCVNPGGGAAGTPGNNMTSCAGSVASCNTLCTTDPFFLAGCCSGMGQLVQPGADCNIATMPGCFCQCT